jgi:hypothetical protein
MADVIRVFAGYDSRQPLAFNCLQHSIHRHTKRRVVVEPLMLERLPMMRRGLTEFTYSRFLVPWLCDYEGYAIFMDSDVVVTGDVGELLGVTQAGPDVYVMKDQPRFEWPSVMVFENYGCKVLTPEFVDDNENPLLDLHWGTVGTLPPEWNHCVGYAKPTRDAKLYHYTQGIPCWPETRGLPEDDVWFEEFKQLTYTCPWMDLMRNSVHAKPVLERMMRKYGMGGVAPSTLPA